MPFDPLIDTKFALKYRLIQVDLLNWLTDQSVMRSLYNYKILRHAVMLKQTIETEFLWLTKS